jgi:peptidoglycan/xylan/chitin deacetylase (PgdA/CDA1 family)
VVGTLGRRVFDDLFRPRVVLAYHGASKVEDDVDPHRLLVDPLLLEAQLEYLLRHGYTVIPADELVGSPSPLPGTAVLTFDDGWHDAVTTVVPMLERLGLSATFFVCPGWFGGEHPDVQGDGSRLVTADDIELLAQHGMIVGSHSMSHRDLRTLDDASLRSELCDSKAIIEDVTKRQCRLFAYPYGLFDERVERAVEEAGYGLAFAWSPGPWRRFATPRLPAPPRHGARRLALKLILRVRKPRLALTWPTRSL